MGLILPVIPTEQGNKELIPTHVGLIMADVVLVEILSIQSLFSLGLIASRIRYLYERNDSIPTCVRVHL